MRNIFRLFLCLSLCLCFVACAEEDSAERTAAQKNMDEALALFDQTDQGYVPTANEKSSHETTDDFRQATLADAAGKLEALSVSTSATHRQIALQLLAEAHASAAQRALRDAMAAWTPLTNESVNLYNLLLTVDRATARVRAFQISDAELIKQLQDEQVKTKRELTVLKERAQASAQRISDLQAHNEQLRKKRDESVAEGRRLRDQAFPMTGDQRFAMYDKAAAVERQGQKVYKEAQLETVDLGVLQSEQEILNRQIQTREKYLASVEQQIAASQKHQQEIRVALEEAQQNRAESIKKLDQRINEIAEAYQTQVDPKFAEAEKRIGEAVQALTKAAGDKTGPHFQNRNIDLELLGKIITQVHIYTSQVMALSDFGRALSVIAGRAGGQHALMPERAEGLKRSADQLAEQQGKVIGQALMNILKGKELATKLTQGAAEGNPEAEIASAQSLKLTEYRNQLQALKLPGLPEDISRLLPIEGLSLPTPETAPASAPESSTAPASQSAPASDAAAPAETAPAAAAPVSP